MTVTRAESFARCQAACGRCERIARERRYLRRNLVSALKQRGWTYDKDRDPDLLCPDCVAADRVRELRRRSANRMPAGLVIPDAIRPRRPHEIRRPTRRADVETSIPWEGYGTGGASSGGSGTGYSGGAAAHGRCGGSSTGDSVGYSGGGYSGGGYSGGGYSSGGDSGSGGSDGGGGGC